MITCLLIVGSCKKEQINEQANNEINWARDYYNTSLNSIRPKSISSGSDQQSGSKTGQNGQNKRTPLWQLSSAGENEGHTFVEVPLDYSHRMGSAVKLPGLSLTQEQRIKVATASYDILLIYKNKNNVIKEQVVTLMPDLAYVERHNGDISGNRLAHLENDFSGYLVYTGWRGEKMFAERIEDGLLVKTGGTGERIMKRLAKAQAKSSREAVMRATMEGDENCITIEYDTYWIECWQIFNQPSCTTTWIREGSNTYCSTGGGNATVIINVEDPGENYELMVIADSIKLSKRFECFNNVPTNGNTTYSIKICADIPVNTNPKALLDDNRAPGHTFIELTKTNGTNSVTETIGFYPESAVKAAFQIDVNSMAVDNQGHKHDSSLSMAINSSQFEQALVTAKNKSANDYNMTGYNCTTFALDVFNSARASNNQLLAPNTIPPNTLFYTYGKTPNGLYNTIKDMVTNGVGGASGAAGTGALSTSCN